MKNTLILLFVFLLFSSCIAQQKYKYTTKSSKAIKCYENATKYYDARKNSDAEKELLKAIEYDKNFIEAHMLLGDVYTDAKFYDAAIKEYKKAIAIDENFFPKNYLQVAKVELYIGRYADAKQDFDKKYFVAEKSRGKNEIFGKNKKCTKIFYK